MQQRANPVEGVTECIRYLAFHCVIMLGLSKASDSLIFYLTDVRNGMEQDGKAT